MHNLRAAAVTFILVLSVPWAAAGQEAAPLLLHTPPAELTPGQSSYEIDAVVNGPWSGQAIELHARTAGTSVWRSVPFLRRGQFGDAWSAVLPGELVHAPGLEYYVDSVEADGSRTPRFATADTPHVVLVAPQGADRREMVRLERHGFRRVQIDAAFQHVSFGQVRRTYDEWTAGQTELLFVDWYNQAEISCTYRLLLDGAYQITFGYGMLGGVMGVSTPALQEYDSDQVPDQYKPESRPLRPGVYYGFARTYWEIADLVGIEPHLLMGASYDGFEVGGGLLLRIGTLPGTHLDFSLDGITNVGFRFVTEFQLTAPDRLRISLRNEVTDFPTGGPVATIPSLNLTALLDGLELTAGIGYGMRKGYEDGGLNLSAAAAMTF